MLATTPGWEKTVERGPGWLLVQVRQLGPGGEEEPLAEELWGLLERSLTYRLVVDLHHVELLNSFLIGQLVLLHKWIREHNGLLSLCGLSPFNEEVLRVHGLKGRFTLAQSVQDAVMGAPRRPR